MMEGLRTEEERDAANRTLAELVAYEGLSISRIPTSRVVQKYLRMCDIPRPEDLISVEKAVLEHARVQMKGLKREISNLKKEGCGFSIVATPWRHRNGETFINLKLSRKTELCNLGLLPVSEELDTIDYSVLVRNKIKDLGLFLPVWIVACTHENSSFMNKYKIGGGVITQLCYNQAIHLAFLNTFCRKLLHHESSQSNYVEEEYDVFEYDTYFDDINFKLVRQIQPSYIPQEKIHELFKHFAVNLEGLCLKLQKGSGMSDAELKFHTNNWNRVAENLSQNLLSPRRYQELLLGCKANESELNELKDICKIWNATRKAVMDIDHESDLYDAEETLISLFKRLRDIHSPWSAKMIAELTETISNVRNATLVTLYKLLVTKAFPETVDKALPYSSLAQVEELAELLINRLTGVWGIAGKLMSQDEGHVKKALIELESALSTIRPTAIETWKVFTTAGSYTNCFNSSLSFEVLNALIFLKDCFNREFH